MIRIDQDWSLEDPVGQPLEVFETCANTIEDNIKKLVIEEQFLIAKR